MDNNSSHGNAIHPLEGEDLIPSVADTKPLVVSPRMVTALIVLIASIGVAGYVAIHSFTKDDKKTAEEKALKKGPVAAASLSNGKKFDINKLPDGAPAAPEPTVQNAGTTNVPAIEVSANEDSSVDPIGVRGINTSVHGGAASVNASARGSPLDSPAVLTLVSSTENGARTASRVEASADDPASSSRERLAGLQDSLKGLMGNLSKVTAPAAPAAEPKAAPVAGLGGQLVASKTPRVSAGLLGDRSLTMPKGTTFNCALKTRIVSEQSGFVSCQVLRNVYSDDGRVLLVERGSHMDGEYVAKYRQGQTRIFVVWSRVRTPNGIAIDIESPATGPLGEAGVDGYVDNHWTERFGAAMLLTIIDDAVKISVANQQSGASTIIANDSGNTMGKVVEKMLDSTINIPPTIFKNQGEVVGIYVAKDIDFSSVYELRTAER